MAIEESQTEEEVIWMMAMSDSKIEDETNQLVAIIVTMMSEMDKMSAGNNQLISNLSCVKLDLKELESGKADLEGHVKDLKNQVLELTSKNEKLPDTHGKGKMSDLQDKFEKELKEVKDNLCDVEYRNKVLQENLEKEKYELSK
ncbi:peroxisomal and mitochondrial division factor 2-like [Nicotiana tomentosiformis]|uniref:peroxisomal and mitochondrial division factor 2-like n=1 Tax=Nicotiana tomentosiformis TaxID=4098 RepID=UPI00388C76F8